MRTIHNELRDIERGKCGASPRVRQRSQGTPKPPQTVNYSKTQIKTGPIARLVYHRKPQNTHIHTHTPQKRWQLQDSAHSNHNKALAFSVNPYQGAPNVPFGCPPSSALQAQASRPLPAQAITSPAPTVPPVVWCGLGNETPVKITTRCRPWTTMLYCTSARLCTSLKVS